MRTDHFTDKHVNAKLGNWGATEELVAVSKKPLYLTNNSIEGNDVGLISTRDLSRLAYKLHTTG